MTGLEQILFPVSKDAFLNQNWGRKALHIKGSPQKFPDLFGWEKVENIVNHSRPSYEAMSLIYDKKVLPPQEMKQIYAWLENGATLAVNSLQQIDHTWAELAAGLGKDLNTHVSINSYISFPSKQGPDIHYDKHDVYIIQTEGRKRWYVYEATSPKFPMEIQPIVRNDIPKNNPYLECELEKGDVLYIPRGHWHHALAVTPSIHLSLGPEARTGIDFLNWIKNRLLETDEFFRQDFPIANVHELGGSRNDSALEKHLQEFSRRLQEILNHKDLMHSLVSYLMQANPAKSCYQIPQLWEFKKNLTEATRLSIHPAQKAVIRHDTEGGRTIVLARGHSIHFKDIPENFMGPFFERKEPFCGKDILSAYPEMSWDKLKPILLNLFERGILLSAE